MEISKRLQAIAGMVQPGGTACDVGTDHGYLAIYLIEQNISNTVIAMDVAKGPLSKAQTNIALAHLENRIETRLSDGLDKLKAGEAQTVIMAGMGGILITGLLEKGRKILDTVEELILSPHTDIELVRRYLLNHGYAIQEETMLLEEGKYYIIMKAVHGRQKYEKACDYRYGQRLLLKQNPVLREYMEKELDKLEKICESLSDISTENSEKRLMELEEEMQCIKEGLKYYEVQGNHGNY